MIARRKKQKFRLIDADEKIDFRRGYKRCVEPGVETGISYPPPFEHLPPVRLHAGFWRNRTGGLFVRFNSSYGYVFHYEAVLINGNPVPDKDLVDFIDFIMEVLLAWGGTDDDPDENFIVETDAYSPSEKSSTRSGRRR